MSKLTITQPVNCKTDLHPILLGIARIFDFVQVIDLPGNKSPEAIDAEALSNDWYALGDDMRSAFKICMEA
ncbi:MAG: hypothetical protein LRZ88_13360 [Candidatus Cloacimonetes bacterium]|nr:hypothetical protein [Candidatus Cloacimonadota bacterium]